MALDTIAKADIFMALVGRPKVRFGAKVDLPRTPPDRWLKAFFWDSDRLHRGRFTGSKGVRNSRFRS